MLVKFIFSSSKDYEDLKKRQPEFYLFQYSFYISEYAKINEFPSLQQENNKYYVILDLQQHLTRLSFMMDNNKDWTTFYNPLEIYGQYI